MGAKATVIENVYGPFEHVAADGKVVVFTVVAGSI